VKECVIRLDIKPPWYATGFCTWTVNRNRAFVFTDARTGPYAKAVEWAKAHATHLRKQLPQSKRDAIRVEAAP